MNMTNLRPVVVKQLPERLHAAQGSLFFSEVEPFLKPTRPRVVLDCSKVPHLDSAGVQVLLRCLEEAMKGNGDVKLAAIPDAAATILQLRRVDHLFETFDNTSDAVNSFDRLPAHTFRQTQQVEYSTPEKGSVTGFEDGWLTARRFARLEVPRIVGHWLMRQIASGLVLFLLVPLVSVATSPDQHTNANGQARGALSAQISLTTPLLVTK